MPRISLEAIVCFLAIRSKNCYREINFAGEDTHIDMSVELNNLHIMLGYQDGATNVCFN
jgi:hypothetical protein